MKFAIKTSGVRKRTEANSEFEVALEEVKRAGYCVIKNFFSEAKINELRTLYNQAIAKDEECYRLNEISISDREVGIIRQIYRYSDTFLEVMVDPFIIKIVDGILEDDWIITQQNGSHVMPRKADEGTRGVQVWHRDFVFRHLTTSKPLLINILVPLDDFTEVSGATRVLPYSHLFADFPSEGFLTRHSIQVRANAGDILILDGLTYHAAGTNISDVNRRSFNTVYAVPSMRHQVNPIPINADHVFLKRYEKFLTAGYLTNPTVLDYLKERNAKGN